MNKYKEVCKLRSRLLNGNVSVGSWMQIPDASVAEVMGQSCFDWVAVDLEHGAISIHQLPSLFRALELGETIPLARVAHGHPKDCKQALDAGAAGIIIPMIESAEQLEVVCDACCWPPKGNRGVGFSRANLFGNNFATYVDEAQSPLIIAMIEHINAIDNIEEIILVEGLDALLIGPYDLSASMGLTAQFDHKQFKIAMEKIHKTANKLNVPCGVHVVEPSHEQLLNRIDEGYRFLAYSIDAVFLANYSRNPLSKGLTE